MQDTRRQTDRRTEAGRLKHGQRKGALREPIHTFLERRHPHHDVIGVEDVTRVLARDAARIRELGVVDGQETGPRACVQVEHLATDHHCVESNWIRVC